MRIRKIKGYPIWQINFPDQYTLAMTFLRMAEHCEHGHFWEKVFTVEEFMDRWMRKKKTFDYPEKCEALTIPYWSVNDVVKHFPSHSEKEKRLFVALKKLGVLKLKKYFLIGTFGTGPSYAGDLAHEIRHCMFDLNGEYRRQIKEVVRKYRVKSLRKWLISRGYSKIDFADEIHAYATTGYPKIKVTREMRALRKELRKIARSFTIPR